jgi:hypothetical protein
MKCFTIKKGTVVDGIPVDDADGAVHVGEEGRGRMLTLFPLPEGSIVNQVGSGEPRLLFDISGPNTAVLILIQDHSGYRGGWSLEFRGSGGGWLPVADGRCAQGIAGAMGGGPEYLGVFAGGGELVIRRNGRLYGEPQTLVVRCTADGGVEIADQHSETRSAMAGDAFQAALAKLQGGAK